MPSRILREGINSSPRINSLSMGAEILYRRLMSVADDYGRYYASPAAIRGACWPTKNPPPSEHEVSSWLEECRQGTRPLILLYESNGCVYLQITDFKQQTRSASKFPEIDNHLLSTCVALVGDVFRISETKSYSVSSPICIGAGQDAEKNREEPKKQPPTPNGIEEFSLKPQVGFPEFWSVWWNKTGKKKAFDAFRSVSREFTAKFLIDEVSKYRAKWEPREDWKWRSRLHPATWLRNHGWEDELPPDVHVNGTPEPSRYYTPVEPDWMREDD